VKGGVPEYKMESSKKWSCASIRMLRLETVGFFFFQVLFIYDYKKNVLWFKIMNLQLTFHALTNSELNILLFSSQQACRCIMGREVGDFWDSGRGR
jgi:hypothetical protein